MKKMHLVLGLASLVGLSRRGTVMRLANEKAKPNYKAMHAEAIGISPDASDDDAVAAHQEHMKLANDMADGMDETQASLANEEAKKKEEEDKAKNEAEPLRLANEKIAAREKKTAGLLIASALTEGRILPAAKADWEGRFANNFDETETALAKEAKKLKTEAVSAGAGRENGASITNEANRRDQVMSLVNEEMDRNGGKYDLAFATVKSKHKDLFGKMKQAEQPTKK